MNTDTVQTVLRLLLKMVAGYLVAHGLLDSSQVTDQSLTILGGIVMSALGLLWSKVHQESIARKGSTQFFSRPPTGGAIIAAILLVGLIFSGPIGCKSPPVGTAYKAASSVRLTVDAAMKAFADAEVAGRVSKSEDTKARQLYGDYLKAMNIARDAAVVYASTVAANPSYATNTVQLDAVLATVATAEADVVNFIQPLIKK